MSVIFGLTAPLLVMAEARPLDDDLAVEARLKALSLESRCLVCQNQTLADFSAPLRKTCAVKSGDDNQRDD